MQLVVTLSAQREHEEIVGFGCGTAHAMPDDMMRIICGAATALAWLPFHPVGVSLVNPTPTLRFQHEGFW